MTIFELKKKYYQKIDSFDFDILIAFILKKNREFILSYPEKKLANKQIEKLENLIKRRQKNEPLAYLLGEKEFFSNKFIVNKDVLVPRPETEIMVEEAIKHATDNTQHVTVIDVGTGSGCIIISLAKELEKRKNTDFYGLDISTKALAMARKNAKLNKVDTKIKFIKSDLLTNIHKSQIANRKSIIITANLPYLTAKQIQDSPSIKKEPRLALVAGNDGLKYYKKLFKQIKVLNKNNPKPDFTIICEIDPSQKNSIKSLSKNIFDNNYSINIKKDLRGLERFAILKKTV